MEQLHPPRYPRSARFRSRSSMSHEPKKAYGSAYSESLQVSFQMCHKEAKAAARANVKQGKFYKVQPEGDATHHPRHPLAGQSAVLKGAKETLVLLQPFNSSTWGGSAIVFLSGHEQQHISDLAKFKHSGSVYQLSVKPGLAKAFKNDMSNRLQYVRGTSGNQLTNSGKGVGRARLLVEGQKRVEVHDGRVRIGSSSGAHYEDFVCFDALLPAAAARPQVPIPLHPKVAYNYAFDISKAGAFTRQGSNQPGNGMGGAGYFHIACLARPRLPPGTNSGLTTLHW